MPNILVPVDGSENSLLAAAHAVGLARRHADLRVHLLNVQPALPRHAARFVSRRTLAWAREASGRVRLAAAERLLRDAGVPYQSAVLSGDAAIAAARYAREHDISCVVVGTTRKSTLARLLTGSFANDLLQRVNVPVEVIAGGKPGVLVRIGLPAGLGIGLATLLLAVD